MSCSIIFFFILNGMLMTIHIVGCILSQWITTQPACVTQVLWCFWSGLPGFQSQFTLDVFQVSTAETGTNSVRCCQLSWAVFLFLCSFKSTPHGCVSEIGQDCWKSIWMVTKNHRLQKDLKHGNRSCSIPSCFSHRWVHQNLDQLRHRNTAVAEDSTSWLEGSSLARATIEEELNTNHV